LRRSFLRAVVADIGLELEVATESAITNANKVRANATFIARNYPVNVELPASDDFASLLAFALFRRTLRHVCDP